MNESQHPHPLESQTAVGITAESPSVARRQIGLFFGAALFLAMILLGPHQSLPLPAWNTAAVAVLMAIWWISEAIPIPVTALVPVVAFPLLGVSTITEAATPYADQVIFLFLGGFILAAALEASGLHRRLALAIISVAGTRPAGLVGGFMVATAFLSMWVSNTATVVMMLPMAISIIALAAREGTHDEGEHRNLSIALLLGVAYASSIGGIGTLIGSPPNALLAGFMSKSLKVEVGFFQWMMVGVPIILVSLPLCWWLLTKVTFRVGKDEIAGGREAISREAAALGKPSARERIVGVIFLLVAAAWIFRPLLMPYIPQLSDSGIAIAGALLLFLVPVNRKNGEVVLEWKHAEQLPWSVLVLFGGGLSLAAAIQQSGLAKWIGIALSGVSAIPFVFLIFLVTVLIVFLTELTSNTATAATFLPLVASIAVGLGADPMQLAIPTAIGASCAFMMPVATPPNALVYASGHVTIPQMMRAGFWLNLIMIVLIQTAAVTLVRWIF